MDARNAVTPRTVKNGERRNRAGVPPLREAIDAYCAEQKDKLDKGACELLARLADSYDAAKAFERLKLNDRHAEECLLTACIEADDVARTFSRRNREQNGVSARANRWNEAVAVLREFVAEVTDENEPLRAGLASLDLWSLSILERPADNAALKQALDLIESSIEWRRGIAKANLAHLGVTRDSSIKQAPENAAIWVLATGVYDAAREPPMPGKPHLRQVADLAEVILGPAISVERVREVLRKRRQLYLEMIGDQTERYHGTKRRKPSASTLATDAVRSAGKKSD